MVKTYLRYEPSASFGVIVSNNCNVIYDSSGKNLICGALEKAVAWNLKKGTVVHSLLPPANAETSQKNSMEVNCISKSPLKSTQVAIGYSNGSVRLWNLESDTSDAIFNGHKSAITAIRFNQSGGILATGSKDTDVILWDVVGEIGLFRLRGHKDQVTDLVFVEKNNNLLISSSKDTFLRVWDLTTQHCIQTVIGHHGEIWSIDLDPSQRRLITGSADEDMRVYALPETDSLAAFSEASAPNAAKKVKLNPSQEKSDKVNGKENGLQSDNNENNENLSDKIEILKLYGVIKRQNKERVSSIRFNEDGNLLACQCAGKVLEIYGVRKMEDALKQANKRINRKKSKQSKKSKSKEEGNDANEDGPNPILHSNNENNNDNIINNDDDNNNNNDKSNKEEELDENNLVTVNDEFFFLQMIHSKNKICSFSFSPLKFKKGIFAEVALSLHTNSIEVYALKKESSECINTIDLGGHRSDIRSLSLNSSNSLLLSTSHNLIKIWNPTTCQCISTIDSGYALSAFFVPGDRHAIVGTKNGKIEIIDINGACMLESMDAHDGAIWGLAELNDGSGFVTASADHSVKFWEYHLITKEDSEIQSFGVKNVRNLPLNDDVLAVKITSDNKFIAVALLDSTIKVFFVDSLKFFLSMYGHKLPVLCLDISSDNSVLVSGSADKNIKIWGMDFGDCHKSIFAHDDSVMQIKFVQGTHYFFSVGKDKIVKYWDADRFENLLTLTGHHSQIWALTVSLYGDFVFSAGHDRSIRRWERTEEPFYLEEEKEKRIESMFEEGEMGGEWRGGGKEGEEKEVGVDGESSIPGKKTKETLSATDSIIEALELANNEKERLIQFEEEMQFSNSKKKFDSNPLMLNLPPSDFVLKSISDVRSSDLEQALLLLPFSDALKLLEYLEEWMKSKIQIELTIRATILLLRIHYSQLLSSFSARPILSSLQKYMREGIKDYKDTLGLNLAALNHMKGMMETRSTTLFSDSGKQIREIRAKLAQGRDHIIAGKEKAKGKKRKSNPLPK